MQMKITMKYYFIYVIVEIIIKNNECWQECGEIENSVHCWWECNMVQLLWKNRMKVKNIKIELSCDLGIPLLVICPKELKSGSQNYILVIETLFTIAKM